MRKFIFLLLSGLSLSQYTMAQTVTIKVIQTSDVHGSFFPYDFINRKDKKGSLARVSTYVKQARKTYGKNVILLDNGDILQGQPTCYYCNFIKPEMPNLAASVINYMGYDAQTVGNHDVETGHAVYDKWISEVKCTVLGANIVDVKTGKPYVKPYAVIRRDGIKVVVLGMLTPAIPNWLKESLWSGLRFDNMVTSAQYWVDYIRKNERPDVLIGLFHSGREGGIHTPEYDEDASFTVAREVPGFDIILFGHDHTRYSGSIKNKDGKDILCLNPSCDALMVSDATINITKKNGKVVRKAITGDVISITKEPIDEDFIRHFQTDIDSVKAFVNRRIGRFENTIYTRDCYFGSAAFTDFIHDLQLKITDADVSFNAPLSFDISIKKGDVHVSDMFNLYKYENQIYVLRMTGREIRKHLEMSYDLWCNTMKSPDDHIMQLSEWSKEDRQRLGFKNLAFNFDSAAGINYEVDVTKPDGEKVRILSMSDGTPFEENKWYHVAMNSYRGNGGGELLTKGAGIPREELKNRIVFESEKDQRYYLMQEIEKAGVMNPQAHNNWRFVPEKWTTKAIERDKKLIFP
ncbi:5'-nucleotidase protein [Hoylesella saccharolytica F0055]|uniref:5'-nucleotidase protein n=1 Tax=Hoylesella saccharolytica F0055 TaxID=1127699 RepID=L1N8W1_9BACT|nr:bifunctional metallophosphatase/5'-nucleotidase [Hoylesella saccharolytica]EKX99646.1 5'-nucleotidase protein [Hoylesella saccharolytica F0055]